MPLKPLGLNYIHKHLPTLGFSNYELLVFCISVDITQSFISLPQ